MQTNEQTHEQPHTSDPNGIAILQSMGHRAGYRDGAASVLRFLYLAAHDTMIDLREIQRSILARGIDAEVYEALRHLPRGEAHAVLVRALASLPERYGVALPALVVAALPVLAELPVGAGIEHAEVALLKVGIDTTGRDDGTPGFGVVESLAFGICSDTLGPREPEGEIAATVRDAVGTLAVEWRDDPDALDAVIEAVLSAR